MQENEVVEPKYGEKIISEFDVEKDLEIWENKHERDYKIKITLPEFCCLCPRSGYPDFATIYLEYVPAKFVVELKAIKLYINSFMTRNISHEDSINEIYEVLERKLAPKWMKITGDFNPRGNVHTVIEICSDEIIKKTQEQRFEAPKFEKFSRDNERSFDRGGYGGRESKFSKDGSRGKSFGADRRDTKTGDRKPRASSKDKFDDKPRRSGSKEGFKKPEFAGEKRARVVKKSSEDK